MNEVPTIKKKDGKIWDIVRKKWIKILPEETLRQQVIHYLVYLKKYPKILISVEKEFTFNGLIKRFDILVINANNKAHILVECKREGIVLNDAVTKQLMPYMLALNPQYLMITNGTTMLVYENKKNCLLAINDIPNYEI